MGPILIPNNPASITTGDLNVSIEAATVQNAETNYQEISNGTINVPAGSIWIEIENVGGEDANDITVNGDVWSVGARRLFPVLEKNHATNQQPRYGAFEIITTGSLVRVNWAI